MYHKMWACSGQTNMLVGVLKESGHWRRSKKVFQSLHTTYASAPKSHHLFVVEGVCLACLRLRTCSGGPGRCRGQIWNASGAVQSISNAELAKFIALLHD